MKRADKQTLQLCAEKLMFRLSDEELNDLLSEFNAVIEQMEVIATIDGVDDASPMSFPFDVTSSYLREDVANTPISKDEALKNCKDVVTGNVRVPRVVK